MATSTCTQSARSKGSLRGIGAASVGSVCADGGRAMIDLFRGFKSKRTHQPRNDYIFENAGIGPHFDLTAQVSARRIDPRHLRCIALVEEKVDVVDGNLRIEHSGEYQHGRDRKSTRLNSSHLGISY